VLGCLRARPCKGSNPYFFLFGVFFRNIYTSVFDQGGEKIASFSMGVRRETEGTSEPRKWTFFPDKEQRMKLHGTSPTFLSICNFVIMIVLGALLLEEGTAHFSIIAFVGLVFFACCFFITIEMLTEQGNVWEKVINGAILGVNGVVYLACSIVGFTESGNEETAKNVGIVFVVFGLLSLLLVLGLACMMREAYKSEKNVGTAPMNAQLQSIFWGEVPKSYARVPTAG
jgi:hypothetical protein